MVYYGSSETFNLKGYIIFITRYDRIFNIISFYFSYFFILLSSLLAFHQNCILKAYKILNQKA
jgi:hypothetical protein